MGLVTEERFDFQYILLYSFLMLCIYFSSSTPINHKITLGINKQLHILDIFHRIHKIIK